MYIDVEVFTYQFHKGAGRFASCWIHWQKHFSVYYPPIYCKRMPSCWMLIPSLFVCFWIDFSFFFFFFLPGCSHKTKKGKCCVLPFLYEGQLVYSCIRDNHNQPWCATTDNYDIDKLWDNCQGTKSHLNLTQRHAPNAISCCYGNRLSGHPPSTEFYYLSSNY